MSSDVVQTIVGLLRGLVATLRCQVLTPLLAGRDVRNRTDIIVDTAVFGPPTE